MASTASLTSGSQPLGETGRGALDTTGVVEQGLAAPVKHLSGGRQHGTASLQREHLQAEEVLQLLDGVGDGRLGTVQVPRCRRVTTVLDNRREGSPLVEGDFRVWHKIEFVDR